MIKTASGFTLGFLKLFGFRALTTPWGNIYVLPGSETDETLIAHETVHLEQIKRDGPFMWTIKVFWYLLVYGYRNSPYEVEAREISGRR